MWKSKERSGAPRLREIEKSEQMPEVVLLQETRQFMSRTLWWFFAVSFNGLLGCVWYFLFVVLVVGANGSKIQGMILAARSFLWEQQFCACSLGLCISGRIRCVVHVPETRHFMSRSLQTGRGWWWHARRDACEHVFSNVLCVALRSVPFWHCCFFYRWCVVLW
jgi:hypothetical protein